MKLSVIIPNCNNEKYVEKCIKSILNQTYKNFEIIVIDDMSNDNSVNIIKSLLRKNDKLIMNKSKRLNGGSRNVGILEATGDYIVCIDNDDYFIDNKVFENIVNKLNNEDIMFLGYKVKSKDNEFDVIPQYNNLDEALKDFTCALWTKVVRTELLKETLFDEGTLFEDLPHHYRLVQKCKSFCCLGNITHVWNRENTNSTSNKDYYLSYRFDFCGTMYRMIKNTENLELKRFFINKLKEYLNYCNEMVGVLNE